MSGTILRYHPILDARLAEMMNDIRRQSPPGLWPQVTATTLRQWRRRGVLTQEGTFLAEGPEGRLLAVVACTDDDERATAAGTCADTRPAGRLRFFGVRPEALHDPLAAACLAAGEEYLRRLGMAAVKTDPVDSRSPERLDFLRRAGYSDPDPSQQSLTMLLGPTGYVRRPVVLPPGAYRLRTWRAEDLGAWLRIRNSIFDGSMDEPGFLRTYGPHNFDPAGWFFVCDADEPVGIAAVVLTGERSAPTRGGYFVGVGVLPERRGLGLGKALMVAGLNYCVDRGLSPVSLNTEPFREAAVALYLKLGFETVARAYRYRKELT